MESVESIAAKIAHEDLVYLDYSPPVYQQVDRMALERAIAAALTAERAKFAAFAGPDGEPRNVLGTLPITADGAIAIPFMSVVYHPDHPTRTLDVDVCQDEVIGQVGVPGDDCTEWHEYAIRDCYSTREAAEAAKGVKK